MTLKKQEFPINVSDLYGRYGKHTILHKKQIIQVAFEGNKYLTTYAEKLGDWYWSDCSLVLSQNPEGKMLFGFARISIGFPIIQQKVPIFKRSLPVEQIKEIRINKGKELQVLVRYGDQSLWKFRFYIEEMLHKWYQLLDNLMHHNKERKSIFYIVNGQHLKQQKEQVINEKIEEKQVQFDIVSKCVEHKIETSIVEEEKQKGEEASKGKVNEQNRQVKDERELEKKMNDLTLQNKMMRQKIDEFQKYKEEVILVQAYQSEKQEAKLQQYQKLRTELTQEKQVSNTKMAQLLKQKEDRQLLLSKKQRQYQQIEMQLKNENKTMQEKYSQLEAAKLVVESELKAKKNEEIDSKQDIQSKQVSQKRIQDELIQQLKTEKETLRLQLQQYVNKLELSANTHEMKEGQLLRIKQVHQVQSSILHRKYQKIIEDISSENKLYQQTITLLQKSKGDLQTELQSKQNENENENVIANLKEENKSYLQKIGLLEKIIDDQKTEIQNKGQQNGKITSSLASLSNELFELKQKGQIDLSEIKAEYERTLKQLRLITEKLQNQKATSEKELDALKIQKQSLKTAISSIDIQTQSKNLQIVRLNKELEKGKQTFESREAKLKDLIEQYQLNCKASEETINELKQEAVKEKQQSQKLTTELKTRENDYDKLRSKMESLAKRSKTFESQVESLKLKLETLNATDAKVQNTQKQAIKQNQE